MKHSVVKSLIYESLISMGVISNTIMLYDSRSKVSEINALTIEEYSKFVQSVSNLEAIYSSFSRLEDKSIIQNIIEEIKLDNKYGYPNYLQFIKQIDDIIKSSLPLIDLFAFELI